MINNSVDICIVGQGLAGTSLAWELHRKGYKLAIVDRQDSQSSSGVAAGLITPITGQRFVKSKQFDYQWETAKTFYQTIEKETNRHFLSVKDAVRVFSNEGERELFLNTRHDEFSEVVTLNDTPLQLENFSTPNGGFEMKEAGRLDVQKYLSASRKLLSKSHDFFSNELNLPDDVQLDNEGIKIPKLNISAERLIFCEGFSGVNNPWFQNVQFDSAKGEILTVKVEGLTEERVVYCGIWMVRIDNGIYRVGATYDREEINSNPTKAGRDELCLRLSKLLKQPFEVIDHTAGVRPIIVGRRPMIGFHPTERRLGYFNGLGSKGSLQSPWFSKLFTGHIVDGTTIPKEYDVSRYFSKK